MFRCDPVAGDVPVVGSGSGVAVGVRTQCGEALRWTPGGDAVALAAFLGLIVVEGVVYERQPSGALLPVDWLGAEWVLVRPPAGEWRRVSPVEFSQQWAAVGSGVSVRVESVVSVPVTQVAEVAEPVAEVSEVPVEAAKKPGRPKKVVS